MLIVVEDQQFCLLISFQAFVLYFERKGLLQNDVDFYGEVVEVSDISN